MSDTEKDTVADIASAENISAAVGKLLEHPELISMVASVLGGASPSEDTVSASEKQDQPTDTPTDTTENTDAPNIMASVMPLLSKLSGSGGSCRHEALLCALKPYVSDSRREAIEYIIKISRMSSLVKGLK